MMLVSVWATPDLMFSLPKLSGMILGLGIFSAVARRGTQVAGWWVTLLAFLAFGLGISLLALFGTRFGTKISVLAPIVTRLTPRLTGLSGAESGFSANEVAGAVVWSLPLLITLTWLGWIRRRELTGWIGNVPASLGLALLTMGTLFVFVVFVLFQSRGGYLGLAAALGMMLLIGLWSKGRTIWIAAVLLLGSAGLALAIVRPDVITLLYSSSSQVSTTDAAAVLESANGRMEIWSRALYAIQDFPFTGMGMNMFRRVVPVLYPLFLIPPDMDIAHAHNEFLQAALDLGLPGLVGFVAIYVIAFWLCLEIWQTASHHVLLVRSLALGLGGGLFAHLVYGMTDCVTLGAKPGFVFWMLLGVLVGLKQQVDSGEVMAWRTTWRTLFRQMA
jgi:putative inorganic carbon (HCO3(-)) transporter